MDPREEVQSGKGFEGGGNEEGGDHGEAMSCGRDQRKRLWSKIICFCVFLRVYVCVYSQSM